MYDLFKNIVASGDTNDIEEESEDSSDDVKYGRGRVHSSESEVSNFETNQTNYAGSEFNGQIRMDLKKYNAGTPKLEVAEKTKGEMELEKQYPEIKFSGGDQMFDKKGLCEQLTKVDMKQLDKISTGGATGDIFEVNVMGISGKYVDKFQIIRGHKNKELAISTFRQVYQEFNKCKNFDHPHIVRYRYFVRKYYKTLGDHEFHLLMEPMTWDMLKYIKYNQRAFHIDQARKIGKNVAQALQYLHDKKRLVHMDIKPQHICFDKYA